MVQIILNLFQLYFLMNPIIHHLHLKPKEKNYQNLKKKIKFTFILVKSASPIPTIIIERGSLADAIIALLESSISWISPSVKISNIKY